MAHATRLSPTVDVDVVAVVVVVVVDVDVVALVVGGNGRALRNDATKLSNAVNSGTSSPGQLLHSFKQAENVVVVVAVDVVVVVVVVAAVVVVVDDEFVRARLFDTPLPASARCFFSFTLRDSDENRCRSSNASRLTSVASESEENDNIATHTYMVPNCCVVASVQSASSASLSSR